MARDRPVCQRASFRPASRASAPLLVKKTRLGDGAGRHLGQPLGQVDLRLVIEIGAGHVDQLAGLVLDGGDDLGMAVPRRGDGDAGGEIEEEVAVDVLDHRAAAALDDQGINARVGRRHVLLVALEQGLAFGPGKRRF